MTTEIAAIIRELEIVYHPDATATELARNVMRAMVKLRALDEAIAVDRTIADAAREYWQVGQHLEDDGAIGMSLAHLNDLLCADEGTKNKAKK